MVTSVQHPTPSYTLSDKHRRRSMPKRALGDDEKRRIAEERRLKEARTHRDTVHVEDETDEDGEPIVTVQYVGESAGDRKNRNA
jgi:L-arabinose isomerase